MTVFPCCPGHEIVGTVARVGAKVKSFKPGDKVGVGPQGFCCLQDDCIACGRGFTMRCPKFVPSYNGMWGDGQSIHHGGFARIHRANMNVVVKIPETIPSECKIDPFTYIQPPVLLFLGNVSCSTKLISAGHADTDAAPMLCAGITAWSPLKRHAAGPGKRIGVVGIGGIGHYALIWAKALGCDHVVAISRSSAKKSDCLSFLGADAFIAMDEDDGWASRHAQSLDLIISTSDSGNMPMDDLLGLLTFNGTFVTVGASPDPLQNVSTFVLCAGMVRIEGSFWGTFEEINEMLQFAAERDIRPVIETYPLADANRAIVNQVNGTARYKYVVQLK